MKSFSNYLLSLHRGALELPTDQFKDWALNLTKSQLSFDSCAWAASSWVDNQPLIHSIHLHQLREDFIPNWFKHQHEDKLVRDMSSSLNCAFKVDVAAEYAGTNIYEHHCKRFQLEHIVGTTMLDEDTQLLNVICFYRTNPNQPFSENDRLLKEELDQHLIEAVRTNWLTNLPHLFSPKQRSSFSSIAACDAAGSLQVAMPSFVDSCRREWPTWKGPYLPSDVIDKLREGSQKYVGNEIAVSMRPLGDIIVLRARSKVPADELTLRELEVAQHFSDGSDYKTIAQSLALSPSTIRTHLNNIYVKLSIDNKANLVSELGKLGH